MRPEPYTVSLYNSAHGHRLHKATAEVGPAPAATPAGTGLTPGMSARQRDAHSRLWNFRAGDGMPVRERDGRLLGGPGSVPVVGRLAQGCEGGHGRRSRPTAAFPASPA